MTLSYHDIPDWPRLRERYLAYWRNEVADSAIIAHVQNPIPSPPSPEPWMEADSEDKYLDPAKLFALKRWQRSTWHWHGDLFPYTQPAYGPNIFTGFCGGRPVFGAHTVWHEPVIASLDEAERIHFDPDNRWWRLHLETVAYFVEHCRGEIQLGMTDLGGPTDWISALMGTENFLIATIEQPDAMRAFALRLAEECCAAFDLLYPQLSRYNDGIVNWMPCWSDGPLATVQDDMAINFSPALYGKVFLPAVRCLAAHAPRAVLHWHDGCAAQLAPLLAVPEITLVQYGHDPNTGSFRAHLPAMRRIQAAGKRLFISCVAAEDAEFFLAHLDPRSLMMIIDTDSDDASARMLDDLPRWTARRLTEL